MPDLNPYNPPKVPTASASPLDLSTGACPRCQSPNVNRPTFTWWGGALGPKLFSHAVCRACGFGFNYKTGKSNSTAIAIYTGAGIVIGIVVVILMTSR